MDPRGLKIVLRCGDLGASRSFYGEVLGLEVVDEWSEAHGDGCLFAVGTGYLELGEARTAPQHEPHGFDIQLSVTGLDDWVRQLGDRWDHEPIKQQPWGERTVRMRDPDGVIVTVYEEARS
jgi:catechol 2,3-dioxygenase-like lactoylglutathione lyase family enzyme